jgi:hypothetical protein
MSTAPGIVFIAGTLTFANEWYQTDKINWRVPIATFGAAWLMAGVAEVSGNTATGLAVMALIVACTTPFGGKSVVQEIASVVGTPAGTPSKTTPADAANTALSLADAG